jgi:hypothetical protein
MTYPPKINHFPISLRIGQALNAIHENRLSPKSLSWVSDMQLLIERINDFTSTGDSGKFARGLFGFGYTRICDMIESVFDEVALHTKETDKARSEMLDNCTALLLGFYKINELEGDELLYDFHEQMGEMFRRRLVRGAGAGDITRAIYRMEFRLKTIQPTRTAILALLSEINEIVANPPASNVIKDRQGNLPTEKTEDKIPLRAGQMDGEISTIKWGGIQRN